MTAYPATLKQPSKSQRQRGGGFHLSRKRNRQLSLGMIPEHGEGNMELNNDSDASQRSNLLSVALMMAGFGAVLLLSPLDTRSNIYDTSLNLRHSRKLAASNPEVSAPATTTSTTRYSPAVAAKVQELAAPLQADEANIFAFDESDSRPIMNTFFAIREGLVAIKKEDAETLAIWKQAWSAAGWNPVSSEKVSISRICAVRVLRGRLSHIIVVSLINSFLQPKTNLLPARYKHERCRGTSRV